MLVYEGASLSQSLAIIEFLEEKHPKPSLLPTDAVDRARARAIAETIASGIQPLQNLSVLQKIGRLDWESMRTCVSMCVSVNVNYSEGRFVTDSVSRFVL